MIPPLAALSCTAARLGLVKHKHRETINKGNVARMQLLWLQLYPWTKETVARSALDFYLPSSIPLKLPTLSSDEIHPLLPAPSRMRSRISLQAKCHPKSHNPNSYFLYCVKLFSLFIKIYSLNDFYHFKSRDLGFLLMSSWYVTNLGSFLFYYKKK